VINSTGLFPTYISVCLSRLTFQQCKEDVVVKRLQISAQRFLPHILQIRFVHFYHVYKNSSAYDATSRKVVGSRPDDENELFSIYLIRPAALSPGVYSASNRHKQQNNVSGE
jgi:hypothetical protein